MLTADQIRDMLRCLPDGAALAILAELHQGTVTGRSRVYEAERLASTVLDADKANELIASLVRGMVTA